MGKLEIKPSDRASIDFAEEERKRVDEEGSVVHKNEIADVEHVEVVYDKDSADININLGYTAGIKGATSVFMDLSKYKRLRLFPVTYQGADFYNNGGTNNICEIDLDKSIYDNFTISKNVFSYSGPISGKTEYFDFYSEYDKTNKKITFSFAYKGQLSNNNSSYYVSKIEGVY